MEEFEDFIAFATAKPCLREWFDWFREKGWTVALWKRSLIQEQTLHSLHQGFHEIIWIKDMPDGVRNAIEFRKTVDGTIARFSLTKFLINDLKQLLSTRNLHYRCNGKRKRIDQEEVTTKK